jgi:peptidoglycan/xylan/chitin deacetylase (PgdA/CDA1 family)
MPPVLPPLALTFHGVADVPLRDDPHRLFASPDDLRRHIAALRRWGYELLTFSDWAQRVSARDAAGCAALTFDDGFADNLHALVPLLDELQAAATVFVVSGWLGQPHPNTEHARILDADEVRALRDAGVEIGAHTVSHPNLEPLDEEAAYRELRTSRDALEDLLGQAVTTVAYPFGRASVATLAAARRAGFTAACRALGLGDWSDPVDLPRQDMGNRSTVLGLRLKRNDRYIPLMRHLPVRVARRARLTLLGAPLRRPRVVAS